jgi:hypothetical protein
MSRQLYRIRHSGQFTAYPDTVLICRHSPGRELKALQKAKVGTSHRIFSGTHLPIITLAWRTLADRRPGARNPSGDGTGPCYFTQTPPLVPPERLFCGPNMLFSAHACC